LHAKISRLESELDDKLIDFISLGGGDYTRKIVVPSDQESYIDEIVLPHRDKVEISKSNGSLVGIVGKGMEATPGVIGRMGSALAKKGINIYYQFDVSPISSGVIVDRAQAEEAVDLLYSEFKLDSF
jgi:aspartokinase